MVFAAIVSAAVHQSQRNDRRGKPLGHLRIQQKNVRIAKTVFLCLSLLTEQINLEGAVYVGDARLFQTKIVLTITNLICGEQVDGDFRLQIFNHHVSEL